MKTTSDSCLLRGELESISEAKIGVNTTRSSVSWLGRLSSKATFLIGVAGEWSEQKSHQQYGDGFHLKPDVWKCLCGFQHFVTFQASGAYVQARCSSVYFCTYRLNIRQPSSTGQVVGVTDVIAADGLFAANITHLSHGSSFVQENFTGII